MGRKVINICDRCGTTSEENNNLQLWSLGLKLRHMDSGSSPLRDYVPEVQWCRSGVIKVLGALPQTEKDPAPPVPELSLGEKIEELVRAIIQGELVDG